MYDIIIVGAGGFGREVYAWAYETYLESENENYRIKGFIDSNPKSLDGFNIDCKVLSDENKYSISENDRFIVAIGNIDLKKKIVNTLIEKEAQFVSLIHHTAIITPTAKIGKGCVICPFVIVSDNVIINDFSMLNYYSSCGHDATVGKYSILSPYATLNGFSVLEDEVFLGTHSTVTYNSKIGYRSKVSANSVAMNDAPRHSLIYGVPGKSRVIFHE
jgi:sugar O-acyltransferase (sialic acid O-acetyltransferase NeuD family)